MLNVSHEKDLIFMRMKYTGDIYFHSNSFAQRLVLPQGKSKLGIGLFIHELLRDPLILSLADRCS